MAEPAKASPIPPSPEVEREGVPRGLFTRLADVGSVAQATVPGLYAWAVTVAPVAWSRGNGVASRTIAVWGVLALLGAVAVEGMGRHRIARLLSVWGLTVSSALVWAIGSSSVAATRLDSARGISGMLGWGLFAYASAAPTFRRSPAPPIFDEGSELRARGSSPRGDRYYLIAAAIAAVALQFIGWGPTTAERSLLVRLVTVGAGIAIITSTSHVTLARHKRGRPASTSARTRAVLFGLGAVGLTAMVGIVLALLR